MTDGDDSKKSHPQRKHNSYRWWPRLAAYIKRKVHQRSTNKNKDNAEPRSLRWTMWSTVAIAVFTVVLAGVSYFQLREMQQSGVESSGQINQMIEQFRRQAAQIGRQADETRELAGKMKIQADQTKTIANEAIIQAIAAKSAAETAKDTLHVSQRAYLVLGTPAHDFVNKRVSIPLINSGHSPSGPAKVVIYEATFRQDDPPQIMLKPTDIIESHPNVDFYQTVPVVPTGSLTTVIIELPALNEVQLRQGNQGVMIAAKITYNDGFPSTPEQSYVFCDCSTRTASTRLFTMSPCPDPNLTFQELVELEKIKSQ